MFITSINNCIDQFGRILFVFYVFNRNLNALKVYNMWESWSKFIIIHVETFNFRQFLIN